MIKKKIKKISLLFIGILVIISVIGCRKKTNEAEVITYTEEQFNDVSNRYNQLKNELAIYDDTYKSLDSFRKLAVIQAGIMTFNKIKDKIVLNYGIANENDNYSVASLGQETLISIGNNIKINPIGWTIQTSTSEIDCSIPTKATGKIKFLTYYGDFDTLNVDSDWLYPFLGNNNLTLQSMRDIFYNSASCGKETTCSIDILDSTTNGQELRLNANSILDKDQLNYYGLDSDSEVDVIIKLDEANKINAKLRSGLFYANGVLCEYQFVVYDNNSRLLVDNLINSITINNNNVYLK